MTLLAWFYALFSFLQPQPIAAVYVPSGHTHIVTTDAAVIALLVGITEGSERLEWNDETGFDDVIEGNAFRALEASVVYDDGSVIYYDVRTDRAGDWYVFTSESRREWQADYGGVVAPHLTGGYRVKYDVVTEIRIVFEVMRDG